MQQEKVRIIITVPNQRVVTVKHEPCNKDNLYTMCNIAANKTAMKELSPNAYKLYMYFDLNQDGYTFALSFKDVHNVTGMSDKTYHKAINELIEKKYLVQIKDSSNQFMFYDGTVGGVGLVETTGRDSKEVQTDVTEVPDESGKTYHSRIVKTTGEIIQDNTKNNTLNNNNGAIAPITADAVKQLKFNSQKGFDDDTIRNAIKATYEQYIKDDETNIMDKIITEFTASWYYCTNVKAIEQYVSYLYYNS